jgi:S1-C subfamily serine protease
MGFNIMNTRLRVVLVSISLFAMSLASSIAHTSTLPVVKVFSEVSYEVFVAGGILSRNRTHQFSTIGHGTGFVVQTSEGRFIVTAAHVLAGPAKPTRLGDEETQIDLTADNVSLTSHKVRVRVGEISLRPNGVYLDRHMDVAVLALSDDDWRLVESPSFRIRQLSTPTARTEVTVYGFPGQASAPMLRRATVLEVQRDFFTINENLGGGFSGGPVVDSGDRLIGMVLRSAETQARILNAGVIDQIARNLRSQLQALGEPHVISP